MNAFIPPFSLIFPSPPSSCSILIFPRLHPQPASLPHPPISYSLSQFRSCHHLPLFLLYFSPHFNSCLLSPVATVPLSPAQALCMFSPHLLSPRISIPPSLPSSFPFSLSDERGSFERERERTRGGGWRGGVGLYKSSCLQPPRSQKNHAETEGRKRTLTNLNLHPRDPCWHP